MTLYEMVRARLEAEEDILFALVFGSTARDDQRRDSDLDVGVYVDQGKGEGGPLWSTVRFWIGGLRASRSS